MTGAIMRDALIQEAKFLRCNLTDVDLRGTAINIANFKDCIWDGIRMDLRLGEPGATGPEGADSGSDQ